MKDRSEKSRSKDANPMKMEELALKEVVISSSLSHKDPLIQANQIVTEFNKRVVKEQSAFELSLFMGAWVMPNQFILGACNQIPELRLYDGTQKLRRGFYLDPTINSEILAIREQSHLFYGAYGSYVLNVPVNKYAQAWSGTIPLLFGSGPHVIHDPNFTFDPEKGLINQVEPYIQHGNIHILRVPAGSLAKIWIDTKPYLLESRNEAYVFNSPFFKLQKPGDKSTLFFNATAELITHGSIKRVMPHTGRVAVTYDCGNLEIISPSKEGPTIIDSPSHEVSSFLDTNIQSFTFPSEEEKAERIKSNKNITYERLNNYVFLTSDSLEIGMKLLVSYKITNPFKTLSQLGENRILNAVESLASVDMAKVVNMLSSQEFLNPYSAKQDGEKRPPSFWDTIKANLKMELESYGIELIRFNIETPFYLDKDIGKKMAESATMTAEANAKQGIIARQAAVQEAEAVRDAKTNQIKQDQINEATLSAAKAQLGAIRMEAEGIEILAKARAKELELKGEIFHKYPELLEFEKVLATSAALGNAKLIMSYPAQPMEHAFKSSNFTSPLSFFGKKPDEVVGDNLRRLEQNQSNNLNI